MAAILRASSAPPEPDEPEGPYYWEQQALAEQTTALQKVWHNATWAGYRIFRGACKLRVARPRRRSAAAADARARAVAAFAG